VTLRDRAARLNRLQQGRLFKIIASVIVALAAIAAFSTYVVVVTAPRASAAAEAAAQAAAETEGADAQTKSAIEASRKALESVLAARSDPTSVGVAAVVGLGMGLIVVWLGLGLTYLGLLIVAVAGALLLGLVGLRGAVPVLLGVVLLTAAFTALMQGLRVLLSGPGPVFAVARNILSEAVRLKISLVFIVILIFGLASLPELLEQSTPLRYRVQTFLQYATAGSFWIIAALVLLFSAASVAFEQRDRVIWQTMTKPVSPWQYVLGKWIGVSGLAAVLLAVCASGTFLFVEYLRGQPAQGEGQAFVAQDQPVSQDRMILETQVLAARVAVQASDPDLDEEKFRTLVADRLAKELKENQGLHETPQLRVKIASDLQKGFKLASRSIEPGDSRPFRFENLRRAKELGGPLTFRFKVNAGANRPDDIYRITLLVRDGQPAVLQTALGTTQSIQISPAAIGDDGVLEMALANGDIERRTANRETMNLPPDGLEISYSDGGYRANFLRVSVVLWIKLAFLAMLAIVAATFLSFPVACLVAFGAFFAAESAGFLTQSLEYYDYLDQKGHVQILKLVISSVANAVAWLFRTYSDLRPTGRLVDGQLVSWTGVAGAAGVLTAWTAALFGAGVAIFKNRELATYSGQ
jgi:ABC-type transport system involved in multi-copper enzyme maturation permease subunit